MKEKKRIPENVRLKIIELRGKESRKNFGAKFGAKDYTIRGIEEGNQGIPYKMAIELEKIYNISREWWRTGKDTEELSLISKTDKLKLVNDLLHFKFLSLDDLSVFELRRLATDHKVNLNRLLDDKDYSKDDMFLPDEEVLKNEYNDLMTQMGLYVGNDGIVRKRM